MAATQRQKRLRWLCRRGMKELDVLLERFIQKNDKALGQGAWPEFEQLLEQEDDELWDWVQNPAAGNASCYRELLTRIRHGSTCPN